MISKALEEYIKTMYVLNKQTGEIRVTDIAEKMNCSKASVTKSLNNLKEKGLVNYEAYGKISLTKEAENIKKIECEKINKYIKPNDYIISLDLTGKQLSSEELSEKIQNITLNGSSTIDFIIGGSLGLTREFVTNSNFVLSFSKLTFPHGLFRGILLEQIYRSFKILNNETYHK